MKWTVFSLSCQYYYVLKLMSFAGAYVRLAYIFGLNNILLSNFPTVNTNNIKGSCNMQGSHDKTRTWILCKYKSNKKNKKIKATPNW